MLAAGRSRLELWRSDMVRMLGYGERRRAGSNPAVPASPLCRLVSAAASSAAVSVLEACPKQPDLRLTLLRAAKEDGHPGPEIRAAAGCHRRLRRPGGRGFGHHHRGLRADARSRPVNVVDDTGRPIASTLLPKPPSPNGRRVARRRL